MCTDLFLRLFSTGTVISVTKQIIPELIKHKNHKGEENNRTSSLYNSRFQSNSLTNFSLDFSLS